MESQVREAFQKRPRLVEKAAGFLGLEVYTDAKDPSLFYLITRWTDEAHFKAWHGSKAHRLSHQGIPAGLKISPKSTEINYLERVAASTPNAILEEQVADLAPILARYLSQSQSLYLLVADRQGQVQYCNQAFLSRLQLSESNIVNHPIWKVLTQEDAESLRARVAQSQRSDDQRLLLNFVDVDQFPITFSCLVDVQPAYFVIVAEQPRCENEQAADELLRLNNEMAVLSRENMRKSKELERARSEIEKALNDLKTSHWHLKKIQDVLPICMECGKVKNNGEWGDVVKYIRENALFLSHGYCPDCYQRVKDQFNL